MDISTDPAMLGVDLPQSMNTSPSVSTFLPDEEASMYPLLPTTPSPPPHFNHPLTPNEMNENCANQNTEMTGDDARAEETSSCSGSSGIGMDVQVVAGTTTIYNQNVYQHLGGKNGEQLPESETKLHANLNLPDSKDVPSFVYWNWKLIRQCSFFCFFAAVIAMVAIVVSMIYSMPRTCNPKYVILFFSFLFAFHALIGPFSSDRTTWYEGSVFYEVAPASFIDSNGDGKGDLRGLANGVDHLSKLGVVGVRLNSIFPSKNYPYHHDNVSTLLAIDDVLGTSDDLKHLVRTFHEKNLSLILDLPIYPHITQLDVVEDAESVTHSNLLHSNGNVRIARSSPGEGNVVIKAIRTWIRYGIDGIYVKNLEHFHQDPMLLQNVRAWKALLGPDRILMISDQILSKLPTTKADQLVKHIDLVDVFVDVTTGGQQIAHQINANLKGILRPGVGPYIQWSLGGVAEHRMSYNLTANANLAATIMSLMLPGSPSICYGDEHSMQESHGKHNDTKHSHHLKPMTWNTPESRYAPSQSLPWVPSGANISFDNYDTIANMIALRDLSPSIYKNVIQKNGKTESNTLAVYNVRGDILILSRWYPRRNRFVSISNFGEKKVTLDLSSYFYSGEIMVGDAKNQHIYFDRFEIDPIKTIVIKLDK